MFDLCVISAWDMNFDGETVVFVIRLSKIIYKFGLQ